MAERRRLINVKLTLRFDDAVFDGTIIVCAPLGSAHIPVCGFGRLSSRHTLKDFFFRSGLKMEEDEALQQNPKFWEMIEAAKTAAKAG